MQARGAPLKKGPLYRLRIRLRDAFFVRAAPRAARRRGRGRPAADQARGRGAVCGKSSCGPGEKVCRKGAGAPPKRGR
eukprot:12474536-Alexandrium_andersonii.AAC.1